MKGMLLGVCLLMCSATTALAGFSDDELRAIYSKVRIRCGMTLTYVVKKYHECGQAKLCEASLSGDGGGACKDDLTFQSGEVILNGQRFSPPPPSPRPLVEEHGVQSGW
jgi:hypothetical protein